jgi:transcriptional regulator with XRE-family HTH domain
MRLAAGLSAPCSFSLDALIANSVQFPYNNMEGSEKEKTEVLEGIARKIKHLRRQRGFSVNALAGKTGFAKSYLSQIENCKREPAIGTLVTIARALGVNVFFLINGEEPVEDEETPLIVKPRDRRTVTVPTQSGESVYESLNYKAKERIMDGYILTPGFGFAPDAMAHEGQELVFVLDGTQEFLYNGKSYVLERGDCCYFDASKQHNARSIGKELSKALVVYTMKK